MPKSWFISLIVIVFSLFALRTTDTTIHYSVQSGFDPNQKTAIFDDADISLPETLANTPLPLKVLGDTTATKTIYVDLGSQRLYAYEGDRLVYNFQVSTGKWAKTPTGTFQIANKFRYVRMTGGSTLLHDYYDLPNVPFVMFFGNQQIPASSGFSLHGTYWHDNFGHPMSHGCVNMKTSEAEIMYNWAGPTLPDGKTSTVATPQNPGTTIIIYGEAPKS